MTEAFTTYFYKTDVNVLELIFLLVCGYINSTHKIVSYEEND